MIFIYLFLSSCVKLAPVMIPKNEFDIPMESQNRSYPIDLGDSRCTYGGTLFTAWTDQVKLDGIYTEGQDKDYTEQVICFSRPTGNMLTVTQPGDFKVIATDVVLGDSDCPQGGKRYESFIDVDGNSNYDSKVDTSYNAKKICNGLNGTATLFGANSGVSATVINSGDSQCPTGGLRLDLFTDMNGNGTYDPDIDTFHTIKYICHGSNSITVTKALASGDTICTSGGTEINTFTDINHNGTYESSIDKNSNTYKVCHGQKALVLSTTLASGDTTCPGGGTQLISCIDSNGDAACTSGPDLNYATQKICHGAGAGFLVTIENAGSNCRAGGYRLDRFQDNNNNAVYDASVDTGYTSTYICNGLNWLSKSTSFTEGTGTAGDNAACPQGGIRFEFGYDHVNSSNGAYFVGTDGILDVVEIVASATAYSCHGAAGSSGGAGPLISKFQNDSEGSKARFYWEIITGDGAAPNVKLGYSSTKAAIQAWNCESALAGVTVVTDFASCTDTTYRTAASGSLNSNAMCGFDLTAAPFSMAAWDYRYFKLCAQNSTSPNAQTITHFRVAGNVPSGMVMVHSDDWPIHEFANTTITPFTYAIDKWEAYLSGGVVTNGTPGVCTSTNCISSSTGILSSVTAQTPRVFIDWYASRKGCANRTAVGYTGASTLRTIHLQTEMEQFVANYGTPDDQESTIGGSNFLIGASQGIITSGYLGCNTDMRHDYTDSIYNNTEFFQTGDIATKNCISRYGARDLIGNYGELLDGYYENTNSNTTRQRSVYWGTGDNITTVISDAVLGYAFPTGSQIISVSDWDYQNLLPKPPYPSTVGPSRKFFSDAFSISGSASAIIAGQTQNGNNNGGSRAGRFNKDIGSNTPTNNSAGYQTVRCTILSP